MKKTEDIMLQLVGRALFGVPADFDPTDTDWEDLYAECMSQALSLLIWDALTDEERSHLPDAVSSRWEQTAMLQMMSNEQLLYEQEQVLRVLSDAGISCVILKGSSSASCYPDPALRNMGDIDLLVEPEEQLAAVHALQEYGYGDVLSEDHHCHMTLSRDAFTVEVHREPNGLFLNENTESLRKIRDYLDDAVARRQYVNGLPFLADDQQAVILLLHKLEHFLTSGLGLRQMCDWAVFVEKKMDTALWEKMEPHLSEFGILYFAGIITKACVDYLGLPADSAPWAARYDSGTAREVIEQILKEGNFGRKASKYGERLFSNPNASGRLTSFCKVLVSACREHWPVCGRHPVLMPVAPFVLLSRYLLQLRRGERPRLHLIQKYRRGGADQKLYKSLKPFISQETNP